MKINLEVNDQNKVKTIFYSMINNIYKNKLLIYYFNLNKIKDNNDLLLEVSFKNENINNNIIINALGTLINDEFIFQNTINEQYYIIEFIL